MRKRIGRIALFSSLGIVLAFLVYVGQDYARRIPVTPEEQHVAAVHEAAHIVAHSALNSGFKISYVWIATSHKPEGFLGLTASHHANRPLTVKELRDRAIAALQEKGINPVRPVELFKRLEG